MQSRSRSRSSSQSSYNGGRRDTMVEPNKRLFIGGISSHANFDEIKEAFQQVGTVEDFWIKRAIEGKDTTFGFVTMSSLEQAEKGINMVSGKRFDERMLFVKYSKPKNKDQSDRNGQGNQPRNQPFGWRNQEEKPQWNQDRGNRNGEWGNREDRGNRGGDRRQGFGQNNQNEQEKKPLGGHDSYIKRRDFGQREGFEGTRKQGDYQSKHQGKPEIVDKPNEDFDY